MVLPGKLQSSTKLVGITLRNLSCGAQDVGRFFISILLSLDHVKQRASFTEPEVNSGRLCVMACLTNTCRIEDASCGPVVWLPQTEDFQIMMHCTTTSPFFTLLTSSRTLSSYAEITTGFHNVGGIDLIHWLSCTSVCCTVEE